MTDINHLPKGADLPENRMTREEWKHYFECREKYDVDYSIEEIKDIETEMCSEYKKGHFNKILELSGKIPYLPNFALQIKKTQGLRTLTYENLSWAKKEYPDEF